jgi:hypothetical protein
VKPPMGLNSNSWLQDLPPNIRLGRKCLTLANSLTYYNMAKITAAKKFIEQAPGAIIFPSSLTPEKNKLECLSLSSYFKFDK